MTIIRNPAVAGTFYPADPQELEKMIHLILKEESGSIDLSYANKNLIGGIVPHAGYSYSGYEAIHFFEILRHSGLQYDTIIIMNPNHQGFGPAVAADASEYWETSLGRVPLDREMIEVLPFSQSSEVHCDEHAAEVMLPFLQMFLPYDFRIVPISFLNQDPETAARVAGSLKNAGETLHRKMLLIASSDFSHYVHPITGEKNDRKIIEKILTLDPPAVYQSVKDLNASVCGYGPIMVLMDYAEMTAQKPGASLLKFGNSAKNAPSDSVVDYASILFYEDRR